MHASSQSNHQLNHHPAADPIGVCAFKVSISDVPGVLSEELSDILLAEGAQSISVEEHRPEGAPEQKIFANDTSTNVKVWDRCTVLAYFSADANAEMATSFALTALELTHLHKTTEAVVAQDWEAAIKDSYQPVFIAPGFWIVPSWSQAPDETAVNLILEPGLAFGSGDHPTTRLCLRWLNQLAADGVLGGAQVMDYGCGSGVLAVAALLLGAKNAVGTDVESLAVKAAHQNAAVNNVDQGFRAFLCGTNLASQEPLLAAGIEDLKERTFDIVVANILQGPLLELAPRLGQYARPGAHIALSGILTTQAPAVIDAYRRCGFDKFDTAEENGWALVTAVKT